MLQIGTVFSAFEAIGEGGIARDTLNNVQLKSE